MIMTLTAGQFNKLVLKEDLEIFGEKLEERIVNKLSDKMDLLFNAVDGIAKQHKDYKIEHVSNISAHDRFERRIKQLEKHSK